MNTPTKSIAVIIITYNSGKTIKHCLETVLLTLPGTSVIVVDNNSKDNTIQEIITANPQTTILKNNENLGFSKACNQASRIAKSDILIFLNPDAFIISIPHQILDKLPKNQILGGKVLNADGSIQPNIGKFPTAINLLLDRIPYFNKYLNTYLFRNKRMYKTKQHVDWISGTCLIVTTQLFNNLGGFNESYFMYGEDVDLCYRAKKLNAKIIYNPRISVTHLDMGKSKKRRPNKYLYLRKGLLHFFSEYRNRFQTTVLKILLLIETCILLLLSQTQSQKEPNKKQWRKSYITLVSTIVK